MPKGLDRNTVLRGATDLNGSNLTVQVICQPIK
jgi:hypothetical protein